jgi:hypothetical protein
MRRFADIREDTSAIALSKEKHFHQICQKRRKLKAECHQCTDGDEQKI